MTTPDTLLQEVRNHISATGYYAFKKGDEYFLYRQAHPKNVFVLKAHDGAAFKRRVEAAVTKSNGARV